MTVPTDSIPDGARAPENVEGSPDKPEVFDILAWITPQTEEQILADLKAAMIRRSKEVEPILLAEYEEKCARERASQTELALTASLASSDRPQPSRPRF